MKISQLLQIQSIIDKRAIPNDMFDENLVYYSKSRDKWIAIADMDICHLIRAFKQIYDPDEFIYKNEDVEIENFAKYIKNKRDLALLRKKEYKDIVAEIEEDIDNKLKTIIGGKDEQH